MSDGKGNHDEHGGRDGHDGYKFRMRLNSPLSPEVERIMTRVIDCAMDVHRSLGPGFLESIYQKAMCIALENAELPFESEKTIDVLYGGIPLKGQRVDLVVASAVVVELKAVRAFEPVHRTQLISYLRTMELRAGLLINFNVDLLHRGIKRVVV